MAARRRGDGRLRYWEWIANLAPVVTPLGWPVRHQMAHCGWAVISKASLSILLENAQQQRWAFYWTESFKAVPTRLGGKTCRREVELATCDSRPPMTPAAAKAAAVAAATAHGRTSARGIAESSFSMHVTCINDAECCVFSPCRMLVLLRKRHVQKWSLEWRSGWNEMKWKESKKKKKRKKKQETGKQFRTSSFSFSALTE